MNESKNKSGVCPICGQPDNCGDCDHTQLSADEIKKLDVNFVDELRDYFKNTPQEEIERAWTEAGEATKHINSPTVDDLMSTLDEVDRDQAMLDKAEQEYEHDRAIRNGKLDL
jgi:hypothetical protein